MLLSSASGPPAPVAAESSSTNTLGGCVADSGHAPIGRCSCNPRTSCSASSHAWPRWVGELAGDEFVEGNGLDPLMRAQALHAFDDDLVGGLDGLALHAEPQVDVGRLQLPRAVVGGRRSLGHLVRGLR